MLLANLSHFTLFLVIYLIRASNGDSTASVQDQTDPSTFTVLVLCTKSKYYCTGSLIDLSWVLTAAHCFRDLKGKKTEDDNSILIIAGSRGINQAKADIKSGRAQIKWSKNLTINGEYDWERKLVKDVALVELSEPFNKSESVEIALFNNTGVKIGEVKFKSVFVGGEESWPCKVYGFGARKEVTAQSYAINKHCHCLQLVRAYKPPFDIMRPDDPFLCDKGDLENSKNELCEGDNGAPLTCAGLLRGIATTMIHYQDLEDCEAPDTSGEVRCGDSQTLRVFTNLCPLSHWIRGVVKSFPEDVSFCNFPNF